MPTWFKFKLNKIINLVEKRAKYKNKSSISHFFFTHLRVDMIFVMDVVSEQDSDIFLEDKVVGRSSNYR